MFAYLFLLQWQTHHSQRRVVAHRIIRVLSRVKTHTVQNFKKSLIFCSEFAVVFGYFRVDSEEFRGICGEFGEPWFPRPLHWPGRSRREEPKGIGNLYDVALVEVLHRATSPRSRRLHLSSRGACSDRSSKTAPARFSGLR